MNTFWRKVVVTGTLGVGLVLGFSLARVAAATPALAVADLDYIDTSGEVRDQTTDHARRLKDFAGSLRTYLAGSGKFRVIALDCHAGACSAGTDPDDVIAAAQKAGAAYVLFGGVHKQSTLLQWAKVEIVNVETKKVVFDRLLTFRGDDDLAWQRAETFLERQLSEQTTIQ